MPVTEEEALEALDLVDQLETDEQKIRALGIAKQYEDAERVAGRQAYRNAQAADYKESRRMPDYFTKADHGLKQENLQKLNEQTSFKPGLKSRTFNKQLLGSLPGVTKEMVDGNYEGLRTAYAEKIYGENDGMTDDAFFARTKQEYETIETVSQKARSAAFHNEVGPQSFDALKDDGTYVPDATGANSKRYREIWNSQSEGLNKKLEPYRDDIEWMVASLKEKKGVTDGEGQDASYAEFTRKVMETPEEDRGLLISAIIANAGEGDPDKESDTWYGKGGVFGHKVAENFLRGGRDMGFGVIGADTRLTMVQAEHNLKTTSQIPAGEDLAEYLISKGSRDRVSYSDGIVSQTFDGPQDMVKVTDEMREEAQGKISDILTAQEIHKQIRDIADQNIDPSSSENIVIQGLYSASRSVPYTLSAGLGPVGFFAVASSLADDSYHRIRRESPGLSRQDATAISTAMGAPQAFMERFQFKILTGKIPAVNGFLNKVTLTKGSRGARFGARWMAGTGLEMVQENMQDLSPFVLQSALSALKEDIPDTPWAKVKADTWAGQWDLFWAVLPMALVGAGSASIRDIKGGEKMFSNWRYLKATGIPEAEAIEIAQMVKKGDIAEAEAATNKAYKESGKDQQTFGETVAEGIKEVNAERARLAESIKTGEDIGILPALRSVNGTHSLIYDDGTKTDYEEYEEAADARQEYSEGRGLKLAVSVFDSMRQVDSQQESGTEQKYIFSSRKRLLEQDVESGVVSEEAAAERIEQREVLEKEQLEESKLEYDQAVAGSDLQAQDESNTVQLHQILGENRQEWADEIIRNTNRMYTGHTAMTIFEEKTEGDVGAWLMRDARAGNTFHRDRLIEKMRGHERVTGDKVFRKGRENSDLTNNDIKEAYSALTQGYVWGQTLDGKETSLSKKEFYRMAQRAMASPMGSDLHAYRSLFQSIQARADVLSKAKEEGYLDSELEEMLARSVGLSEQYVNDRKTVDEAREIADDIGQAESTFVPTDNAPFSIIEAGPNYEKSTLSDGRTLEGPATFSIIAYHGTPHEIEGKMSTDKMGTGEGSQAWGWGLYFAALKATGESYQKGLAKWTLDGVEVQEIRDKFPDSNMQLAYAEEIPFPEASEKFQKMLPEIMALNAIIDYGPNAEMMAKSPESKALIKEWTDQGELKQDGNLYKVSINAKPEEFLDWNVAPTDQSDLIKDLLRDLQQDDPYRRIADIEGQMEEMVDEGVSTVEEYYHTLIDQLGSAKDASVYLNRAGVKGMKYLDGNSRKKGEGTYNYVIFDENLVEIIKKNGKAVKSDNASFSMIEAVTSTSVSAMMRHPGFKAAKFHRNNLEALSVVDKFLKDDAVSELSEQIESDGRPPIFVPVISMEGESMNAIPVALAFVLQERLGGTVHSDVVKVSNTSNTGADAATRASNVHEWEGEIPHGNIILVDDTFTTGHTLDSLEDYLGEEITAVTTLSAGRYGKGFRGQSSLPAVLKKAGINKRQYARRYGKKGLTGGQLQQYILNGKKGKEGLFSRYPAKSGKRLAKENESYTGRERRKLSTLTYFSGGGLVEEGLRGLIDPQGAVEYDPNIAAAYKVAHGDHVDINDIRMVDPAQFAGKEYFHASPVCKNSSLLKSKGKGGVETGLDIESAEATVRAIAVISPKVFTLENVPAYRKTEAMGLIRAELERQGYNFDEAIYNAADYGAPTDRKRYLVRAVKDGLLPEAEKQEGPSWFDTVSDMIDDLPDMSLKGANYIGRTLSEHGIDPHNVTEPLLVSGSQLFGKVDFRRKGDKAFTFKASHAAVDRILMPGGVVKRVSARAKARMSGLPDSFPLPQDEKLGIKIVGNGVPPALVRNVFGPVIRSQSIRDNSDESRDEISFSVIPVDPYKDREGDEQGEPLTETEIREGIEDEPGTLADVEMDRDKFSDDSLGEASFSVIGPVPMIKRSDLKGKKKFIYFSDRTRVGEYTGLFPSDGIKIDLQGGPFFPYIKGHGKGNAGWAFTTDGMWTRFNKRINITDGIGLTTLYAKENLRANPTFLLAYVQEVESAIKAGRLDETEFLEVANDLREGLQNTKKWKPESNWAESFSKPWESVDDFSKALEAATFEVRASMFFAYNPTKKGANKGSKIGADKLVAKGFPNISDMVDLISDPAFDGMKSGTIVGAIQFEAGQKKPSNAKSIGSEEHLSYPVVTKGKGIGMLSDPIHVLDVLPNPKKKKDRPRVRAAETRMQDASFSMIKLSSPTEEASEMFSPFMRSPELRIKTATTIYARYIDARQKFQHVIDANKGRAKSSVEEKRKEKEAELFAEKLDGLSPAQVGAMEAESEINDPASMPMVTELIHKVPYKTKNGTKFRNAGRIKSISAAKKDGDSMALYDGLEGKNIPRSLFGGDLSPDQAAQETKFDDVDEFWDALDQEISSHQSAVDILEGVNDDIKQLEKEAKEESYQWSKVDQANNDVIGSDRATLLGFLRTLDAIISALPMEIRGKIGGFVKLATFNTPQAMLGEIERRKDIIDRELERWLKKEADKGVKKLFASIKKSRRLEAGKTATGKNDYLGLFDAAEEAYRSMSAEEGQAASDAIQKLIDDGSIPKDEIGYAMMKAELIPLFAGWNGRMQMQDVDGEQKRVRVSDAAGSAQRIAALETMTRIWKEGKLLWQEKQAKIKERRDAYRAKLEKGLDNFNNLRTRDEQDDISKKRRSLPRRAAFNMMSFDGFFEWFLGTDSLLYQELSDGQRIAENEYTDSMLSITRGIEDFFTGLTGSKLAGRKLQFKLSKKSVHIKPTVGEERFLSQMEMITAKLMWRQEDGKRHMIGRKDEDGNIISDWSYDDKFMAEVEAKISKEALEVFDYLSDIYVQEWQRINPVYKKLFGIDMPRHVLYAPLTMNPEIQFGSTIDPATGFAAGGKGAAGWAKTRGHSTVEPDFRDALKVFVGHSMQVEHFISFGEFSRELRAITGRASFRNKMKQAGGQDALDTLRILLDDTDQGGVTKAGGYMALNQVLENAGGRMAQSILFGKATTILVNATQLGAAAVTMSPGAYISRFSKLISGELDWFEALNTPYIQRRISEMPPIIRQALESKQNRMPRKLHEISEKIGFGISGADGFFTAGTYVMVLDHQREKGAKKGKSGADLDAWARNETERIMDKIAQPIRRGARSTFENEEGRGAMKTLWNFASEARKNGALAMYAFGKGNAQQKIGVGIYLLLLNGLLVEVMRTGMRDLLDPDEDEDDWDWGAIITNAVLDPLYGVPIFGSLMQDFIKSLFGYRTFSGTVLDSGESAVPAIKRFLEMDYSDASMAKIISDVNKLLSGIALMSQTAASAKSIGNILEQVAELFENLTTNPK
jgi:DNA (cytosine-5)-methyltransferase 1